MNINSLSENNQKEKDESFEIYNEKELKYLDKYLTQVKNAFDEDELYEIILDCEYDDEKIERTIKEKLRYLKFKGTQYGWNVVDSKKRMHPVEPLDHLKKEQEASKAKTKSSKTNTRNRRKKINNNYNHNYNNYDMQNGEVDNYTYQDYNYDIEGGYNYTTDKSYKKANKNYYHNYKNAKNEKSEKNDEASYNNYGEDYTYDNSHNYYDYNNKYFSYPKKDQQLSKREDNYYKHKDYYGNYDNQYNQYDYGTYENNDDYFPYNSYKSHNPYNYHTTTARTNKYSKKQRPGQKNKGYHFIEVELNDNTFSPKVENIPSEKAEDFPHSTSRKESTEKKQIETMAQAEPTLIQVPPKVGKLVSTHHENKIEHMPETKSESPNIEEIEEINVNKTNIENLRSYFDRLKQKTIFNESVGANGNELSTINTTSNTNNSNYFNSTGIYEKFGSFTGINLQSGINYPTTASIQPKESEKVRESNVSKLLSNLSINNSQILEITSNSSSSKVETDYDGKKIVNFSLFFSGTEKKQKSEEKSNVTTNIPTNKIPSTNVNYTPQPMMSNMNPYPQYDYMSYQNQRFSPYMNPGETPSYTPDGQGEMYPNMSNMPGMYEYPQYTYYQYPYRPNPMGVPGYQNMPSYPQYQERGPYQAQMAPQELYSAYSYPMNPLNMNYYQPNSGSLPQNQSNPYTGNPYLNNLNNPSNINTINKVNK